MFLQLEGLKLHNDYSSCIVSNILKQLLCFCDKLQSFDLKLVDSLDDILWCQILGINPLAHLVSFSLDQCHCISGKMKTIFSAFVPSYKIGNGCWIPKHSNPVFIYFFR